MPVLFPIRVELLGNHAWLYSQGGAQFPTGGIARERFKSFNF